MNKYPSIIVNHNGVQMLLLDDDSAIILDGFFKGELHEVHPRFRARYKNITAEYLANTYGKVLSPEYAGFIIELCESNGIEIYTPYYKDYGYCYFVFAQGGVYFFGEARGKAVTESMKQITIPMPPKGELKEAGYNLMFGGEAATEQEIARRVALIKNDSDSFVKHECSSGDVFMVRVKAALSDYEYEDDKMKDWPQVGDEVMFTELLQHFDEYKEDYCNEVSRVIARTNTEQGEFITVHREYCTVMTVRIDRVLEDGALTKPKTEDEILRDDIAVYLCDKYNFITGGESLEIVNTLMSKYNITKKGE